MPGWRALLSLLAVAAIKVTASGNNSRRNGV
jgi:hypothetical protein